MKKLLLSTLLLTATLGAAAQNTPTSQMEKLDRGLVVIPSGSQRFLSWRFLGTDDEDRTRFTILRNGKTVAARNLYQTSYTDKTAGSSYQIITLVDGMPVDTSKAVKPWSSTSLTISMQRPEGGTYPYRIFHEKTSTTPAYYEDFKDTPYTYSPNDCSVGDVDGDGEYELFVKWDPSNSQDNSRQCGKTGNVYIDCYKLDGTLLWRVDLGKNIRAGAHYTQFQVYDLDKDGKAEMICKTAPGSKDGKGNYVNQAATDETIKSASNTTEYRNQNGAITGGQEYLTVFCGETGEAVHTVFYNPNRNQGYGGAADGSFNWGKPDNKSDAASYGNRGERYLSAVAYLDGTDKPASAIFCRGYYGYAFVWAVDYDGQRLSQRWLHNSDSKTTYKVTTYDETENGSTKSFTSSKSSSGEGRNTMFANGNHNMSIADVDGDGKDEIIWGSAALDDDGKLLYAVGFGHGDAMHLGDHCPDRPGLEVFDVHEDKGTYAWDLHDAATGEIILKGGPSGIDNGRGLAGNFDANVRGSLFWSGDKQATSAVTGKVVSSSYGSMNFRIYWDDDLYEELLDGNKIDKWNGNGTTRLTTLSGNTCNSTKNTPNLQADILGDWREEVILWNGTTNNLVLYTPTTKTNYRVPTLMHDHTYRMAICWQNSAYNQPPHLGYYLPDTMLPTIIGDKELTVEAGENINWVLRGRYATYLTIDYKKVPSGMDYEEDYIDPVLTLTGCLTQAGDYVLPTTVTGLDGKDVALSVTIHVTNTTGITTAESHDGGNEQIYDLQGRKLSEKPTKGIVIIVKDGKSRKVFL